MWPWRKKQTTNTGSINDVPIPPCVEKQVRWAMDNDLLFDKHLVHHHDGTLSYVKVRDRAAQLASNCKLDEAIELFNESFNTDNTFMNLSCIYQIANTFFRKARVHFDRLNEIQTGPLAKLELDQIKQNLHYAEGNFVRCLARALRDICYVQESEGHRQYLISCIAESYNGLGIIRNLHAKIVFLFLDDAKEEKRFSEEAVACFEAALRYVDDDFYRDNLRYSREVIARL